MSQEPYGLERLVPEYPEWTEDAVWRGSFTAAKAKLDWEINELLDALGEALPDRLGGVGLQEMAATGRRQLIYPPGISSGMEYAEYLDALSEIEGSP